MTNNQGEKIEEYLSGEMPPEEQKSFEQELEADTALAAAFHTYRDIETHMRNIGKYTNEVSLKSSLTKLGDEFFKTESETDTDNQKKEEPTVNVPSFSRTSTKRSSRLINVPIWQVAAAILFGIVIIGTWYILTNKKIAEDQVVIIPATSHDSAGRLKNSIDTGLQNSTSPDLAKEDTGSKTKPGIKIPNNEQLVEKHFEPDAAPKDLEGPLEDAFAQYEKGQFTKAVTTFENADLESVTRGDETDIELTRFYASYYKALSYMAIKNYSKAIQLLKDLKNANPLLQVKVQWYLALAYIRTGNLPKATSLLHAIDGKNEAGEYRVKAHKLLTELNGKEEYKIIYPQ